MVTKMKMFGFLNNDQVKNQQVNHQVKNKEQISSPPSSSSSSSSSSQFNMKNLAAIMKIQNTGCKSCRG
jgi:hypothetical protein